MTASTVVEEDGGDKASRGTNDVSKTERILNLVAYLLKERRPVPWREIAGRVVGYDDGSDPRALERRFERDKAALKEMGVRIIYCPPGTHAESEGYLIPREACFLDKLELMPHESALLNLLSELALRKGGTAFSADLMSALQKLRFDSAGQKPPTPAAGSIAPPPAPPERSGSKKRRGRPPKRTADAAAPASAAALTSGALEGSLLDLDLTASLRTDPNVATLTQALVANQRVAFTYFSMHSGEKRRRELDPYGIGFSRGAWYVVGHDHLRNKIQQFRLDRIDGAVELAGEDRAFNTPKGFKITDYIEKLPWEMKDAPPIEVRIEVAPDLAFFVEDLVAGKGTAQEQPDGGAIVRLDVRDRAAFVKWVLAHLRHVRILEPKDLRDELLAALDELSKCHGARP
jgi:predicted DNA-binding transcriptional regulator YafY